MEKYDVIIIGFGKAGKTLAGQWASQGKKVALIEKDVQMFGGTCINIGCIPTKTLMRAAKENLSFEAVIAEKDAVTHRLRDKNYQKFSAVADIKVGTAKFISDKEVEVTNGDQTECLKAEIIVINTGAVTNTLPINGLLVTENVYDSTGIQNLTKKPGSLGIIGGGNIGLEFAYLYQALGTKVSIIERSETLLARYEPEVAQAVVADMEARGMTIHLQAEINKVSNNQKGQVVVDFNGQSHTYDAVLYATGRNPNIADLNLEATNIELTERGAIKVDAFLQTTVPNVFAVGDVNGGPQFTYISLDDYRIVAQYVAGNKDVSLQTRLAVPNSLFIKPTLAQVGLTQRQAQEAGFEIKVNRLPVAAMPKAHVENKLAGLYKVVVDAQTNLILGATFYGEQAYEIINLVTMAMDNKIPYTYFQKQIFTHPSFAENLNDLFNF